MKFHNYKTKIVSAFGNCDLSDLRRLQREERDEVAHGPLQRRARAFDQSSSGAQDAQGPRSGDRYRRKWEEIGDQIGVVRGEFPNFRNRPDSRLRRGFVPRRHEDALQQGRRGESEDRVPIHRRSRRRRKFFGTGEQHVDDGRRASVVQRRRQGRNCQLLQKSGCGSWFRYHQV